MYAHVLLPVALDHNPFAARAMRLAETLMSESGKVTLLNVVEQVPEYVEAHIPPMVRAEGLEIAKAALADLSAAMPDAQVVVLPGAAAHTILEFAANNAVDCIVIASHKPGSSDYLLGSTAARVVRHAQCAVHVVR